jgi:hypothetical protein
MRGTGGTENEFSAGVVEEVDQAGICPRDIEDHLDDFTQDKRKLKLRGD